MVTVNVSERVEAPADAVWDLLGDFGGVARYTPGIESCQVEGSGVGAVRTLGLPGGLELQERLESLDGAARCLEYSILAGPIPVKDYLARIQVIPDGGACTVNWSSSFASTLPEADAEKMLAGVYRAGIAGVRDTLGC